jgi:hypothetical protein
MMVKLWLPELPLDQRLREENGRLLDQVRTLSNRVTVLQATVDMQGRRRRWAWLHSLLPTRSFQRPPDVPNDAPAVVPTDMTPAAMLGGGAGSSASRPAPSGSDDDEDPEMFPRIPPTPPEPAAVVPDVPPSPPVPDQDDFSLRASASASLGAGDGEDLPAEGSG